MNIMHQCGSYGPCATCRVEFLEGEPEEMTEAEQMLLEMRDLLGEMRLSCQVFVEDDMKVRVVYTVSGTGAKDAGGKPEGEEITPEPVWVERPY